MKLKTLEPIVLEILGKYKQARCDDFALIYGVYKAINNNIADMSFKEVMQRHNELGLPSLSSITRCRRHIQELIPELKDDKTTLARLQTMEKYKNYNLSDIGER